MPTAVGSFIIPSAGRRRRGRRGFVVGMRRGGWPLVLVVRLVDLADSTRTRMW